MNWYRIDQFDRFGQRVGYWVTEARNAAHAFDIAERRGYVGDTTYTVNVTQIGV